MMNDTSECPFDEAKHVINDKLLKPGDIDDSGKEKSAEEGELICANNRKTVMTILIAILYSNCNLLRL